MLFDMRTYVCRPGTVKKHLALYRAEGLEAQRRHLGDPFFYGVTETGPLNSFVHIWAYASAADRERRRAALQADPEWKAYLEQSAAAGFIISQENRLLTAADFFAPGSG